MKFFRAVMAIALGLIASISLQGCGDSEDDGPTGMGSTTTMEMEGNTTTMVTSTTMA